MKPVYLGERLEGVQKRTVDMEVSKIKDRQLRLASLLKGTFTDKVRKIQKHVFGWYFPWKVLTEVKIT